MLIQPNALTATMVSANDSCYGSPNGSAALNGAGGVSPYSYNWSNGGTAAEISNLTAGAYTVTLTDGNLCSATSSTTITQPAPIVASTSSTNATNGQYNGSATVTSVTGGVPPYNVRWSNGQSGNSISSLGGGTYIAIVSDQNGCQVSDTVIVNDLTGIDMVRGNIAFSVYPNPSKTTFTVELSQLNRETTLTMKDVLGQTIFTKTAVTPKTIIDLANFAEGVYLIELKQGDTKAIKQVVVAR